MQRRKDAKTQRCREVKMQRNNDSSSIVARRFPQYDDHWLLITGHLSLVIRNFSFSQSHKVSQSQSHKVSQSQSHKVSQSQSHKVSQSQSHKVSQSQSHKVSQSHRLNSHLSLLFLFCFLLFAFGLFSQETWEKIYRPFQRPNWTDRYELDDVIITQDGGYVISGSYELFGHDPWEYENWAFLMKTDSDGNLLWAVDDSLEYMLSNGYNIDFTELQDGSLLSIGFSAFGGGGNYMIKRDSEGNRLWLIPYDNDFGFFSMKTTSDGNVILAGSSNNNASLRKIDPDGNTIWTSIIDVGHSVAYSVCETSDGGYAMTGTNYEDYDVLVIKTDSNGDSLWTRTFEGLDGHERGNCIFETIDGNIIASGYFRTSSYDRFGFVASITTENNLLFCNQYEYWNIRTCIEDDDSNYVINSGHALLKTNVYGDTLWCTGYPYWGYYGDKCLQKVDLGFLYISKNDQDYILLTKTDENGQVTDISHNVLKQTTIELINFPNPFNPSTTISFGKLDSYNDFKLQIYNTKGQLIKEISIDCNKQSIIWDGTNQFNKKVGSGVYYYQIISNENRLGSGKMLMLK
ncbi:MAG: T9SS type A sorting domain-containing protein [Candidatus Cloacimonetes bacterium]|nr:T9SS type A sorting domain-containing protein [Candidatus Cloacimonadota bacterium]